MNKRDSIILAGRVGFFCARHLFALIVTIAVPCALWTVVYIMMLVWAVLAGGGVGGPLVYPLGLLFLMAAGTAASLFLLFPATVMAEWYAWRRGLPALAQIPISVVILAAICLAIAATSIALGWRPPLYSGSADFVFSFLALLLLLGVFWWAAQSGPVLLSLLQRFRQTFHPVIRTE